MEQQSSFTRPTINPQYTKNSVLSQKSRVKKKTKKHRWNIVYAAIISILLILVIFFLIAQATRPDFNPVVITPEELKTVTQIHVSEFDQVGTAGLPNPLLSTKIKNVFPSIETGPNGKPLVFSSEAEYCPYCAAQRWAMVVALSQFGTFHKLNRITSSENAIATFTFQQSVYNSPYIDLMTVERPQDASQPAPPMNAQQKHLISVYNAPPYVTPDLQGKVPFIDIGNRYVMAGAAFDVHILIDHSWQEIANVLSDHNSSITQAIIGAANYAIAAICTITQGQPSSVCQRSTIVRIQNSLS